MATVIKNDQTVEAFELWKEGLRVKLEHMERYQVLGMGYWFKVFQSVMEFYAFGTDYKAGVAIADDYVRRMVEYYRDMQDCLAEYSFADISGEDYVDPFEDLRVESPNVVKDHVLEIMKWEALQTAGSDMVACRTRLVSMSQEIEAVPFVPEDEQL